jgi:hypothetical protein
VAGAERGTEVAHHVMVTGGGSVMRYPLATRGMKGKRSWAGPGLRGERAKKRN